MAPLRHSTDLMADAESWRERAERAEATVAALRGALATAAGWCPRCKGRGGLAVRVGGETHHGDCPGCEAARAALSAARDDATRTKEG
jgi:hypothetical protein